MIVSHTDRQTDIQRAPMIGVKSSQASHSHDKACTLLSTGSLTIFDWVRGDTPKNIQKFNSLLRHPTILLKYKSAT